jgi:hypothetical protein
LRPASKLPLTLTKWRKEIRQRETERRDQPSKSRDPYVPLATLDASDVVPVQIRALRQLLLRDFQLLSKLSDMTANCSR